jgi:hypothetical protein
MPIVLPSVAIVEKLMAIALASISVAQPSEEIAQLQMAFD